MKKFLIFGITVFFSSGLGLAHQAQASTKLAALTFDDGPYGQPTSQVLDILERKKVKVTFFVIGKNAQMYPALLQREIDDGDVVANHSWDHARNLATMPAAALQKNLQQADMTIGHLVGVYPRFFRPPYDYSSVNNESHITYLGIPDGDLE